MKKKNLSILMAAMLSVGCSANGNYQKTPLAGIVGGAIGYLVTGDAKGAAIGAAFGLGVGAMMDHQEKQLKNAFKDEVANGTVMVNREKGAILVVQKASSAFEIGSHVINQKFESSLDKIARIFRDFPDTEIIVAGHTDSTGNENYNQKLSEDRANQIIDALSQRGIDMSRMTGIGFGETAPIASNGTDKGRSSNRRVDIIIKPYAHNETDDPEP